jgi:hypothetical protein
MVATGDPVTRALLRKRTEPLADASGSELIAE